MANTSLTRWNISPSLLDFSQHILNECHYIVRIKQGKTCEELLDDGTISRAIIRSLEIIGEATKKLPDDFKISNSQVAWNEIAGMRDVLIHNYFGVDYDIVWNTISNDIPYLYEELDSEMNK